MLSYSLYKIVQLQQFMCSYKNRVLAVTKNIVLLQDGQLQKLLQALHPKYAVTNSSCYKLFCYCLQLQNDSYKIANSYKMCSLQFTEPDKSVAVTCTFTKLRTSPIRLPTATP